MFPYIGMENSSQQYILVCVKGDLGCELFACGQLQFFAAYEHVRLSCMYVEGCRVSNCEPVVHVVVHKG